MQEGMKTTDCKDLCSEMSITHNRLRDLTQDTESFWTLVFKGIKVRGNDIYSCLSQYIVIKNNN